MESLSTGDSFNIFDELRRHKYTGRIGFLNPNSRSRYLVSSGQPLSLMLLMGICRDLSIPYGFIEGDATNMSEDQMIAAIIKGGYDYVGIPLVSLKAVKIFPFMERISRETKVKIIVGGPLPSADTRWLMESCPSIGYAVIGEGEATLPRLLLAIENKKSFQEIPGIAYWSGGELVINQKGKDFITGEIFPTPDFDALDYKIYPGSPPVKAWPSVNLFATRGCPYKCTFCSNPVWLHKPNATPVSKVLNWIETVGSKGAREIFFIDDTFNVDDNWFKELCHGIIRKGFNSKMTFKCLFRANMVNPEQLSLAKKAGFWLICYGAESGDPSVLKYYKKGETREEIANAVEMTRRAGIRSLAGFIVGAPVDTADTVLETVNFIRKIDPTYVPMQILYPFMGTKVADDLIAQKLLTADQIRNYDHMYPTIRTASLSTTDLLELLSYIRSDILAYKKSPLRHMKRKGELIACGWERERMEIQLAYEAKEAEVCGESGMPNVVMFDSNMEDMEWMPDNIDASVADIRFKDTEWHEREEGLRWSRLLFKLPFMLREEKQALAIEWATMRPNAEVEITLTGAVEHTITLHVTQHGWHLQTITLPKAGKGLVWMQCRVATPFRAVNDTRELGIAFRKAGFIQDTGDAPCDQREKKPLMEKIGLGMFLGRNKMTAHEEKNKDIYPLFSI